MFANAITVFRVLLCLGVAYLLFVPSVVGYWTCFVLTLAVICLDGLDGIVARRFNETSKMGAVLDIIGDRVVEQVYWIVFLALGWIPLWIPLVVIVRGVVVDGLRSVALEQGYTAFGSSTMMTSKWGYWLTGSRWSRWAYGMFKAVAFSTLILANLPSMNPGFLALTSIIAYISVYAAVFFCVVRGIPVILESRRFLSPST